MEEFAVLRYLGPALTFLAVAYGVSLVGRLRRERSAVRMGLADSLSNDPVAFDDRAATMHTSFMKRVFRPSLRQLSWLIYRLGPKGLREQTKDRLIVAGLGERIDPDLFFSLSLLMPVVVGGGLYGFSKYFAFEIPIYMWLFAPASATFPKMWLTSRVETRQRQIRLALSDTLDMLTIAVEAGLGFDAALARVVSTIRGPLSDEMFRMLQELRIGIPRHQAFRNLADRTQVQELDEFITAMNQADSFGVSIGNVLRAQAQRLRKRRSQLAEERGAKTPVKLLFPLILCIFPALFTVLVGPAAIQIMDNLIGRT